MNDGEIIDNPYSPPTADLNGIDNTLAAAEALRREHLNHETNMRVHGAFWMILGVLIAATAAVNAISAFYYVKNGQPPA